MKWHGILFALALLGIGVRAEAGEIIVSIERLWQLSSQTPQSACTAVAVRLGHENEGGESAILTAGLAPIEWFPISVSLNESTSGGAFTTFTTRLTDGENGSVTFSPRVVCDSGTEFFQATTQDEFGLFGNGNDLFGYDLEAIRVHYLDIDLDFTMGVEGSFRARFDFEGQPVPEPGSLGLAFLGATALVRIDGQRQGGLR